MLIDATLITRPPQLGADDAEELAHQLYGMQLRAYELSGERDRNFRMDAADGRQYLLKIFNPAEAPDVVNLQTSALEHIGKSDPDLPVPHIVKALDGSSERRISLKDGRSSIVRMLTFLQGVPLHKTDRTASQRRALGRCLARLDRALVGFAHPASQHDILWNVASAHRLKGMIDGLADVRRRKLVARFMADYETLALPRLSSLRAQVIHNDFNLGNVLAVPGQTDAIAAIIDFGDIVKAPLIGEVATAAAYQLAHSDDPLASAADLVGAYHDVIPLLGEELEILFDLIAARLMITVLITEWRAVRYPENRAYIMRNNGPAWAGLEYFGELSRDEARSRLLQFCSTGEKQ
ncbi:hypothetical protein CLG96_06020 [Sphingomonas oleivorans]|uniref:Hydroxylysine kinase n=1 Tax=Sphingomonas oleivorans TaxID=1735121 RepID=A0A2T5FZJ5_9SPHN|nr:phosphotransferase [Sphingomonas oleivorans]PTQ12119.1 hypothetical protein CLG96_06020 [Sphingomonas oleivorans]